MTPFSDVAFPELARFVEDSARVYSGTLTQRTNGIAAQLADVSLRLGLEEVAQRSAAGGPDSKAAARFLSHIHIHGVDPAQTVETGTASRLLRVIMDAPNTAPGDMVPLQSAFSTFAEQASTILGLNSKLAPQPIIELVDAPSIIPAMAPEAESGPFYHPPQPLITFGKRNAGNAAALYAPAQQVFGRRAPGTAWPAKTPKDAVSAPVFHEGRGTFIALTNAVHRQLKSEPQLS
jgi:hypothetical protein